MENDWMDLLTLQRGLQLGIEELFPDKVRVRAEIASISVKSNGHCYLELSQTVDGRAVMSAWRLYIESWSYQLGTYRAVRAYTVTDGVIAPASRDGWTYDSNDFYLIVKRSLPVFLDSGGQTVLSPGTAIRLTGTDGNIAYFTGGDLSGYIYLEYAYGWYINGVSENEYFEMLPYAG